MSAERKFDRLGNSTLKRVDKKIIELSYNPFPQGVAKLTNLDAYRIRIGNYRIICTVEGDKVTIQRIRQMKEAYR